MAMQTDISIHAPLTGCDCDFIQQQVTLLNFNPRTPYGMRPYNLDKVNDLVKISIHAPLTGCDTMCKVLNIPRDISIHAPLTGCDQDCMMM